MRALKEQALLDIIRHWSQFHIQQIWVNRKFQAGVENLQILSHLKKNNKNHIALAIKNKASIY